jgi:hypothetical protein
MHLFILYVIVYKKTQNEISETMTKTVDSIVATSVSTLRTKTNLSSVTTDMTLGDNSSVHIRDSMVITLPLASENNGIQYTLVKKTVNDYTVQTSGSDLIEYDNTIISSIIVTNPIKTIFIIVSDGGKWVISESGHGSGGGPAGPAGADGADGADSTVVGPAGTNGTNGAKGDPGEKGDTGADSTVVGPAGTNGTNGAKG